MTPALKAMVEAMVAEAKRQDAESAERAERMPWLADEPVASEHAYDWRALARAGLAAIRIAGDEQLAGANAADLAADVFIGTEHEGVPADPADAMTAWTYMIDAILKETP